MTDAIKVGQITKSFWKDSQRPEKITPTALEDYNESTSGIQEIAELTRRLSDLEGQIHLKVDGDRVNSAIVLAREALLITSDKIGVLGDVSFFDYVRDQNGQATGEIDPSMTRIRGGVIQTEQIKSHDVNENQGSVFDLDNGTLFMGGTANPRFLFQNDPDTDISSLEVMGVIRVKDKPALNTNPAEFGYFATGTAGFDGANFTGAGVLIGSPGVFAVSQVDQSIMFALNAVTGDAFFGGNINTGGYIKGDGNNDTGFTLNLGDGVFYEFWSSMYGSNATTPPAGQGKERKFFVGNMGSVDGYNLVSLGNNSYSAGLFGISNNEDLANETGTQASPNRFGVYGFGNNDYAVGVCGVSINGLGMFGSSTAYYGGKFTSEQQAAIYCKGKGTGVLVDSDNPSLDVGVAALASIQTGQKFMKADVNIGTLELYNQDGSPHLVDQPGGSSNVILYRFM